MEAKRESLFLNGLKTEWERIELLARLLTKSRQGEQATSDQLEHLQQLQWHVEKNRNQGGMWRDLVPSNASPLELDILVCAIAPEVEPRLGWLFQSLQPGIPQPYPTVALIQELLALAPEESSQIYKVLSEGSCLRLHRLIEMEGNDPYQPIRPGASVTARLLGRPAELIDLPGTNRVTTRAAWDSLVLPADRTTILREFLLWIRYKHVVVQDWGGQECGGPVALFSGPSGTGKTFAAVIIATELGWPLYRIDLGCLVSKYIGETEKNLNRLFDAAHEQPMILQFDEADSLFSKRGEVKEARDRYANMEVSHLLARIESHRGPVILTTNMRKHLDSAFSRRFQIVVDFPRPDKTARGQLWQKLLPPQAPYLPEVDPISLGDAVSLTGGNIRNAALHAAYIAAGTGQPISLRHVALAVWRELGKDGHDLSLTDLGPLADYLPEEGLC